MPVEPSTSDRQETIGTDAVVIAPQQDAGIRTLISIVNTSAGGQVIYLGFGTQAAIGKGVPLSAGGYWVEDTDTIVYPTQKQITAISSAAGGTVAIHERTITGVL